jgi:predicted NUDIX family phosphoesterase
MAEPELVLVIPTAALREAGTFQGLTRDVDHYLPRLLGDAHPRFLPRAEMENDPSWKQLIPYVVLRHGGRAFHYTRGQRGSEQRLHARRSVGIGGHINPIDGPAHQAYAAGLARELAEEVAIGPVLGPRCLGLINDDRTPVGQVHLGIVHEIVLETPTAQLRDPALVGGGFAEIADLCASLQEFETWSQFVLEMLRDEGKATGA